MRRSDRLFRLVQLVRGRRLSTRPAWPTPWPRAIGWQVAPGRRAGRLPAHRHWVVMGRSDVREDRIEVRRVWLRGAGQPGAGPWCCRSPPTGRRLDTSLQVGTSVHADLFRYPGRARPARARRVRRHGAPVPRRGCAADVPPARATRSAPRWRPSRGSIAYPSACSPRPPARRWRWVLTDTPARCRSPTAPPASAPLLACSGAGPCRHGRVDPLGLVPLTVHLPDRAVDVGPVADSSFVGAGEQPSTQYWHEMVTVALLGTDRRDPPDAAARRPGRPRRRRTRAHAVAAAAAAGGRVHRRAPRRCGAGPAGRSPVAPPARDPRPLRPPAATGTWRRVVADWPVLEDEWCWRWSRAGRRLAPELVPPCWPPPHRRHARTPCAGRAGPLGDLDDRVVAAPRVHRRSHAARCAGHRRAARAGHRARAGRPAVRSAALASPHVVAAGLARRRVPSPPSRRARQPARPHRARRHCRPLGHALGRRRPHVAVHRPRVRARPTSPTSAITCSPNWSPHDHVRFPRPCCARTPSSEFAARARRAGRGRRPAAPAAAGGSRRGRWSPTCWAARWPTAPSITPKYVGNRRLIEIAVATLATDRALLLLGVPGTAKTWVCEHLAAAISGDSTLLVQGTAGTAEEAIRYGWNYARLLAEGPSRGGARAEPGDAGDARGRDRARRGADPHPADVQDALITILSEKTLPIPELDDEVQALTGFNVIATANDRDRGVNELSSRAAPPVQHGRPAAAGRPPRRRSRSSRAGSRELGAALELPPVPAGARGDPPRGHDLPRAARRRHRGRPDQAQVAVGTLSTAEAISVVTNGLALAAHFGDGALRPTTSRPASSARSSRTRCTTRSSGTSTSRRSSRERAGWADFYDACRELTD